VAEVVPACGIPAVRRAVAAARGQARAAVPVQAADPEVAPGAELAGRGVAGQVEDLEAEEGEERVRGE
jgi:hypothetical protein